MKTLKLIERALARIEGWLVVLFLSLMIFLTFLQILLRSLYTHAHISWANALMGSLDWSEPFVRLLVLWLTFLGASLLTREDRHIKIDLMTGLLPSQWLALREVLLSLVCIVILSLALKASIVYIHIEMTYGAKLFMELPSWAAQMIIPLGFATILFRLFLRGLDQGITLFRGKKA